MQACEPVAQQSMAKHREMESSAARLGYLFWQLNAQQLSAPVLAILSDLAAAVSRSDWPAVQQLYMRLTASHWDECSHWLQAIKRLSKTRSTLP